MKTEALIGAISNIDYDLLEDYITKKEYLEKRRKNRKGRLLIKWCATVAACFLAVFIGVPTLMNLRGYNSPDANEELYNRTHSVFNSYTELSEVIGDETLIKNLKDVTPVGGFNLKHALDNPHSPSSLTFTVAVPVGHFSISVHFSPYIDSPGDICDGSSSKTVNGILVEYEYVSRTVGEKKESYYDAEFKHGDRQYIVSAAGDITEEAFFETVTALIGNG